MKNDGPGYNSVLWDIIIIIEGETFMTYTAAQHQGAVNMFWLLFWGAPIFVFTQSQWWEAVRDEKENMTLWDGKRKVPLLRFLCLLFHDFLGFRK